MRLHFPYLRASGASAESGAWVALASFLFLGLFVGTIIRGDFLLPGKIDEWLASWLDISGQAAASLRRGALLGALTVVSVTGCGTLIIPLCLCGYGAILANVGCLLAANGALFASAPFLCEACLFLPVFFAACCRSFALGQSKMSAPGKWARTFPQSLFFRILLSAAAVSAIGLAEALLYNILNRSE